MADNQTKPTKVSVTAFIDAITDDARRADAKALVKLMKNATGEKAAMWGPSIVGFGSYHYKYESGREGDMPVVGFSPRKAATVLYGLGLGDGGCSGNWGSILRARGVSISRNWAMWIKGCWRR